MASRRRSPTDADDDDVLPPLPPDLATAPLRIGDEEYAVLSFSTASREPPSSLSRAEREILQWLVRGRTNLQIAAERGTSARTVANQVQALFRKIGVKSRAELAAWFSRGGIRS